MESGVAFGFQFVLVAAVAGLIGAAGMAAVLFLFSRKGWTRANLIVALGSVVTRKSQNAFGVGITLHAVAGIVFAMVYTIIFAFFGLDHPLAILFVGLFLGFLHGIVMSLIIVVTLVLSEGDGEFKKVEFSAGPVHLIGHIVYGLLVGAVVGLSGLLA